MTTRKTILDNSFGPVKRIHDKYYDTSAYIALVVTAILIMQIILLMKGNL